MTVVNMNPGQEVHLTYGGRCVAVRVRFGSGQNLSITVHPDQRVTAVAPVGTSLTQIARKIEARAHWIIKQQRECERYKPFPTNRRYVSGETHLYLGKQYRLKVRQAATDRVRLQGGYITVETADKPHPARTKRQLDDWYRRRAKEVLLRRFAVCEELLHTMQLPVQTPLLRRMARRWGSCGRSARILLNPELVKVPVQCIDYVIVHELCHLKVLHHSVRFYSLLGRYMPDWEKRKARLDAVALPAE